MQPNPAGRYALTANSQLKVVRYANEKEKISERLKGKHLYSEKLKIKLSMRKKPRYMCC